MFGKNVDINFKNKKETKQKKSKMAATHEN